MRQVLRSFFHRVEARVRFIRPRVTILRPVEREAASRPTFFRLAAIDKYSTGARYVCKQVARQLKSPSRISSHMHFKNIHDQTMTREARERESERERAANL
jgi:hypothetical protein